MMDTIERRVMPLVDLEVRAADADEPAVIRGYAAVFGQLSDELGGFREKIRPGAFATSLEQDDVRALWNHDANYVLGRRMAGTLSLEEDEMGLRVLIVPPDTTWANDLITSMARGDVNQMSFGFKTRADSWEQSEAGTVRELLDVQLFDVSVVTFPAYPQTSAEARNKAMAMAGNGQAAGPAADDGERPEDRAARLRRLKLAEAEI